MTALKSFLVALTMLVALVSAPVTTAQPPVADAGAVEPTVARIDTTIDFQNATGNGAGFVIDPGGVVLTNFHVVQGADTINASVGDQSFAADLLGYDRGADIAVLQLRGAANLPAAPLGDAATLTEGEPVVSLGNAGGSDSPLTREVGSVVGFGRVISAEDTLTGNTEQLTDLIEFAAPVRAGDSGGPLVDSEGRVVGVTTAATVNFRMEAGGEGFAIPINRALAVADQIRSGMRTDTVHIGPPTLLGVGVLADSDAPGVVVTEVLRGGPADAAGVTGGDVLTSLDGTPLDSATTLTSVLDRRYPGDAVELSFIDDADGQRRSTTVTLTPSS